MRIYLGRVELVSRVLDSQSKGDQGWAWEIERVFESVKETCDILLTKGCSMHVHVSKSDNPSTSTEYSLPELKRIVEATAFFDDAVTRVLPADRKRNPWAFSMFAERADFGSSSDLDQVPKKSSWKPAYTKIKTMEADWNELFSLIDPPDLRHEQGRVKKASWLTHTGLGQNKYFGWNFKHVLETCGTVEFRRPPGVKDADTACHWVAFTLGYVHQALNVDWNTMCTTRDVPSVNDLASFVSRGAQDLGLTTLRTIKEDTSGPTVFTVRELKEIKRKMADKATKASPFAIKVRCPAIETQLRSTKLSRERWALF